MKNAIELFSRLHETPELSMHEEMTKQIIIDYLHENTSLEVNDAGDFLYAVHFENAAFENVAYRADIDAIKSASGKAFHGCGHDGHSATLCRLAEMIDKECTDKNVYFFFQRAEETGEGAKLIAPHLKKLNISRIYGYHNIPKFEEGTVLLRDGTFACASKGMTVTFTGKQSHAAYPESGVNPAFAIARVIGAWNDILKSSQYEKKVLATIVNVSVGESDAFGVNAGKGSLSVTIRAELDSDLKKLENAIKYASEMEAKKEGISLLYEFFDCFPATINSSAEFERAKSLLTSSGIKYELLESPMRWSEDFGHYLNVTRGMFLGIGTGKSCPDLHTENYTFNTEIIERAAEVLKLLL